VKTLGQNGVFLTGITTRTRQFCLKRKKRSRDIRPSSICESSFLHQQKQRHLHFRCTMVKQRHFHFQCTMVTSTEISETTDLGILFSCRCLACNSRVRDVLLSRQSFRYRTPCAWLCDTTSIQSFPTPPTQTIKSLMICVFRQTSKQQRNRELADFDMASHMKISVLHLLVAVLLLCEVIGQRSYSRRTYRRPGARTRYSSGTIRRKGIAPQSIHKFY